MTLLVTGIAFDLTTLVLVLLDNGGIDASFGDVVRLASLATLIRSRVLFEPTQSLV